MLIKTCVLDAGRHSDGGVLSKSTFSQALNDGNFFIPNNQPIISNTTFSFRVRIYLWWLSYRNNKPCFLFVIVGDEVLPLKKNMLSIIKKTCCVHILETILHQEPFLTLSEQGMPYYSKYFWYPSSKVELFFLYFCVISSSFYRWRSFRQPIIADLNQMVMFVKATTALHNYLCCEEEKNLLTTVHLNLWKGKIMLSVEVGEGMKVQ